MNFLEAWLGSESVAAAYGPVANDYHPNRPKLPLVSKLRSYLPNDFSSRSLLKSPGVTCRDKVNGCHTTFADAKGRGRTLHFRYANTLCAIRQTLRTANVLSAEIRLMALRQHS